MRVVKLPKGNGKFRTIYSPASCKDSTCSKCEMCVLKAIVPAIATMERQAANRAGVASVAHGFIANRSPVTCADRHRRYSTTISCDLSSWFDSVTYQHLIAAGMSTAMASAIVVDGACRQGLPTSPSAANLVAVKFDRMLQEALSGILVDYVYTRYADDITISTNEESCSVVSYITICAEFMGWSIAEHKTRVQYASAGKRIVVGIAVDARLTATRSTKRKLRAALHQRNRRQANGLREWSLCKMPNALRPIMRGGVKASVSVTSTSVTSVSVTKTGVRRISFE